MKHCNPLTKMNLKQHLFPFILMLTSLILLFVLYRAQHPIFQTYFFDSDALYLPTFFQDILHQHGHIKDWYLTPAPYFFPDDLLFLVAYFSAHTVHAQIIVYAILQIILLTILLYFFFNTFTLDCAALTAIALLWLAINTTQPFTFLLMSAFHYGTFLIEIASLALFLRFINSIDSRQQRRLSLMLCILSWITTCSDALFFVQFIIPMFISYLITQHILQKKTQPMSLFLLPIVASIMGFLSYPFIVGHPTRYSNRLSFSHFYDNLQHIQNILHGVFTITPITMVYIIVFYLSTFFACGFLIINKKKSAHQKPLIFLLLFIQISAWVSLVSMFFISQFTPTIRYLIPAFSWPIIIGVGLFSYGLKKYFHPVAIFCMIMLITSLSTEAYTFYKKNGLSAHYYPSDIACIDEALSHTHTLHHGIAQYWDAKFIQMYSKHTLIIAQYKKNLTEHRWITSSQFYRPTYDFAIISTHPMATQLSRKKLKQYNGIPLNTIHCSHHDLLIYAKQDGVIKIK